MKFDTELPLVSIRDSKRELMGLFFIEDDEENSREEKFPFRGGHIACMARNVFQLGIFLISLYLYLYLSICSLSLVI